MSAGFTMYPNLVLLREDLTPIAKTLYGLLCHYAREDERAFPGQDLLHTKVPCSIRGLGIALRSLEGAQLVETHRMGRGRNNQYVLLDPNMTPHQVKQAATDDRHTVPIKTEPLIGTQCTSRSALSADPCVKKTQKKKTQHSNPPKAPLPVENAGGGGGELIPFDFATTGLSPKATARIERTRRRLAGGPDNHDGDPPR